MTDEDRLGLHQVLPIPEILARLFEQGASGTLHISCDKADRRIVVVGGEVRGVRSSIEAEMLGTWLVEQSKISEGERALALLAQGGGTDPLGQVLSEQGRIDGDALDLQIRRLWLTIIERAAAEPKGFCEFREDDVAEAGAGVARVTAIQTLLVAARACPDEAFKKEAMGDLEQCAWPARGLNTLLQEVELTPTEAFLLSRLRGTDTLGNLVRLSSLAEELAISTLYGLCLAGVVCTGPTPHPVPADDGRYGRPGSEGQDAEVDEEQFDEAQLEERQGILERAERAVRVDHFAALGINNGATDEEIDLAWSMVQRAFSRSRTSEPHLRDLGAQLETVVDRARDAFSVLSDEKARRRYIGILDEIENEQLKLGQSAPQPETDPGARKAIVEANFERADQLLVMGELYGAVQLLENACALEPRPEELVKLARLLLRNPQWSNRALRHLQHATEVDPNLVSAWIELAEFWRRKADIGRQRRALKRALSVDPRNEKASVMLRNITVAKKESRSFLDRFLRRK